MDFSFDEQGNKIMIQYVQTDSLPQMVFEEAQFHYQELNSNDQTYHSSKTSSNSQVVEKFQEQYDTNLEEDDESKEVKKKNTISIMRNYEKKEGNWRKGTNENTILIYSQEAIEGLTEEKNDLENEEDEEDEEDSLKLYFPQNRRWKIAKGKNKIAKKKRAAEYLLQTLACIKHESQRTKVEVKYSETSLSSFSSPLQGYYFLSGDLCIMSQTFEKQVFHRFSELNTYKGPAKTTNNILQGVLEVHLNNKRKGLKSYQFIIDKLLKCCSLRRYHFALLLEQYQQLAYELEQKITLIQDEESSKYYNDLLDASYNQFIKEATTFLENFSQAHTFYQYTIYRLNLINLQMEMTTFGYSEPLLALLGLDVNQAQSFVWRKGLFDYLDTYNIENTLFQVVSHMIDINKSKSNSNTNQFIPFDVILHTFDGLEVVAKAQSKILTNIKLDNPFQKSNEILNVTSYSISPTMIKQIIEIRTQQANKKSIHYIRDIEEDLQYSMEAANFLEKYYNNTVDGFIPHSKRAGIRLIQQ